MGESTIPPRTEPQPERMATNMAIRSAVDGIQEIIGTHGMKMIFANIGLTHLAQSPPDYSWEPCIPTSQQAKIYAEVVRLVGLTGGIAIWRRIGYTNVRNAVEIGHVMDAFKDHPDKVKYQRGMEILCAASGKGKPVPRPDGLFDFDCPDCLLCEGYQTDRVMCAVYEGTTQFVADWSFGKGVYLAREITCKAKGDETCYVALVPK